MPENSRVLLLSQSSHKERFRLPPSVAMSLTMDVGKQQKAGGHGGEGDGGEHPHWASDTTMAMDSELNSGDQSHQISGSYGTKVNNKGVMKFSFALRMLRLSLSLSRGNTKRLVPVSHGWRPLHLKRPW